MALLLIVKPTRVVTATSKVTVAKAPSRTGTSVWVSRAESFSWVKKKISHEGGRIRVQIMCYKKLWIPRKKGGGEKSLFFEGLKLIAVLTEQCLSVLFPHLGLGYLFNRLQLSEEGEVEWLA